MTSILFSYSSEIEAYEMFFVFKHKKHKEANMKKFFVLSMAMFLLSFGLSNQASGMSGDPNKLVTVKTFVDMAKKSLPAVVSIHVEQAPFPGQEQENDRSEAPVDPGGKNLPFPPFGGPDQMDPNQPEQPRRGFGSGSGFIISADGYIVTNNHVVEGAAKIAVFVGKKEYSAKTIGTDPETDIALIKIEGASFPALLMGDSDMLEVGEPVMAIGSPFGLNGSVTTGIVSAKNRRQVSGDVYDNFIQTDASINPGNSGGPLIDTNGKVIGMNTAILSGRGGEGNVGIGFAVPSNLIKEIIASLKESGSVTRGWFGIVFQPLTKELSQMLKLESDSGALVKEVVSGGPAEKGGIKREDVIVSFNDEKVSSLEELPKMVASVRPGTSVPVEIWRNGKKEVISVVIEKRDSLAMKKMKKESQIPEQGDPRIPRHPRPRR